VLAAVLLHALVSGPDTMSAAESAKQASQCWASARQTFTSVPLFRPAWLPVILHTARVACSSVVTSNGPADLEISYRANDSNQGSVVAVIDERIPTTPKLLQDIRSDWTILLRVGGRVGSLLILRGDVSAVFAWQVGSWRYAVEAQGISVDDLLRLIASERSV
jgi:hypothetical protein